MADGYGGARPKTRPPRDARSTRPRSSYHSKPTSCFAGDGHSSYESKPRQSYKGWAEKEKNQTKNVPGRTDREIRRGLSEVPDGRRHVPNDMSNDASYCTRQRQKRIEESSIDYNNKIIYNRRDRQNQRQRPRTVIETLSYLDSREPDEVIRDLLENKSLLKDWLVESPNRPDIFPLILSVIAKAFSCRYLSSKTTVLYQITLEAGFFNSLVLHLIDRQFQGEFENCHESGLTTVIANVLTIVLEITSRNPSATKMFSRIHLTIGKLIEETEKAGGLKDDTLARRYKDFTNRLTRQTKKEIERNTQYSEAPPDDFRDIDIFPNHGDIHNTIEPFIRKNKKRGQYDDIDHYLDVQFRLLREDFVGPLRDGINEYIRSKNTGGQRINRQSELRIYRNVRIVSPVCLAEGLCFQIQLHTSSLQGINWRQTKRLIFGSLLCLTTDDFATFMIATVAGREIQDLERGLLQIRFEGERIPMTAKELFSTSFTVAETTAYFESYRHVLSGLQHYQEGDLPFEKYLLKCEIDVAPPSYLDEDTVYDFGPLIHDTKSSCLENPNDSKLAMRYIKTMFASKKEEPINANVLDLNSWPSADRLKLDDSQYAALKAALTKEIALIQGPPGTGKTFIGLKIAKLLLHNRRKDASHSENEVTKWKTKPMLIVCFTNHALDQFLEGIARFFGGNILRAGGQSKNDNLQELTLQKLKQKMRGVPRCRQELREEMDRVAMSINDINAKIDGFRRHILWIEFLQPFIPERIFQMFIKGSRRHQEGHSQSRIPVERWLQIWNVLKMSDDSKNQQEINPNDMYPEMPDIVSLTNSRRHFDEGAIQFETERQKRRAQVIKELRKTDVAFFFEEESRKDCMSDKDWDKQKAKNMEGNLIIQKFICSQDIMTEEEELLVKNPWKLKLKDKWKLYRLWVKRACKEQYENIAELEDSYKDIAARYKEAQFEEDAFVMKQVDVIGMTTTCAARYLTILHDIGPNIVIVEEAAEVLEAHIVTTLSRSCKHLILIGDHKQLRPNPSVYALATKFNLDVSLFERMILNGVSFNSLELQHRMRPEISILMRHIYDNLKDHDSVKKYENIKGISSNMFLMKHDHPEESDTDGTSHSNVFEAEYASALCKYLLQQGYKSSQITVLATYTSQMFLLRRMIPKDEFEGITITVVDNYQGEENDIIVLSLVRSNQAGIVGFLKIENRICVALSRAKMGFFILGNFELLAAKSELWRNIVSDMEIAGQIGDGLALYCQNHPELDPLVAKTPTDFARAPEGGCTKVCQSRLPCGHSCKMFCHPIDSEHKQYKCDSQCTKSCEQNHPCKKLCHETCGDCPVIVEKTLPRCGHKAKMQCGRDAHLHHCRKPCNYTLDCGHTCKNECGSNHTVNCGIKVLKIFQCGHRQMVPCNSVGIAKCERKGNVTFQCGHNKMVFCKNVQTEKCRKKCNVTLKCGHSCSGSCFACSNGRFHQACKSKCKRILVCEHECLENCSLCLPCTRKCENRCIHSHCDKLCGEPCTPCMEVCAWKCPHKKCTRPCSKPCNRGPCNRWCEKKLPCKHYCIGLCGEPCPSQCRICNKDEVTTVLFGQEDHPKARFILLQDCKHIIESRALDKYMYLKTENTDRDTFVQLKGCPICKTPIRKSFRYGKLINQTLNDIERVKQRIIGEKRKIMEQKSRLERIIRHPNMDSYSHLFSTIRISGEMPLKGLTNYPIVSAQHLEYFENQLILLEALLRSTKALNSSKSHHSSSYRLRSLGKRHMDLRNASSSLSQEELFGKFQHDAKFPFRYKDDQEVLKDMVRRLTCGFTILTEQEIEEIKNELRRCEIMKNIRQFSLRIPIEKLDEAKPELEMLQKVSRMKAIAESDKTINEAKENLQKLTSGMNISEDEKKMILRTVGLSKGHWYKCPNGHVYAIGECGGANQEGLCPECRAKIGGKSHRLAEGNSVATEMDGATFGAYSEEANNLGNFILEFDE